MRIYIYIYTYIHTSIYTYVYTYINMYVYIYMYIYIYIQLAYEEDTCTVGFSQVQQLAELNDVSHMRRIPAQEHTHTHTHTHTHVYICMYILTHTYISRTISSRGMCVYIYTYICMCVYIYINLNPNLIYTVSQCYPILCIKDDPNLFSQVRLSLNQLKKGPGKKLVRRNQSIFFKDPKGLLEKTRFFQGARRARQPRIKFSINEPFSQSDNATHVAEAICSFSTQNPADCSCAALCTIVSRLRCSEWQRGSRSLSHADGPLWAALLKTVRCDDAVVAPSSSSLRSFSFSNFEFSPGPL